MSETKPLSNINNAEIEHQISNLEELNLADHVIISLNPTEYRHAIVNGLNKEENQIEIVFYDDSQIKCSLSQLEQEETVTVSCEKNGVKKSLLKIDLTQIQLYKVDYTKNNQKCLSETETLEKAHKFLGQTKYNIFTNNDEHFCIYCKTGKAAKLFIISPDDISVKKLTGVDLKTKIVSNLAQETGQIVLVNTAKTIATRFPRSAISTALPAAAEVAGGAIGASVEAISAGYDIHKKHKELIDGKINDTKFKKYVAKRVTRGVNSVAGGVAGGIIGQMIIPVPVLGAVVGSLIGGVAGAAIGQAEGILLGEVVEIIDDKIKEIQIENSKNQDTFKSQYNVLQHLVFKFRKDILNEENFKHLHEKNDESSFSKFYVKTSGEEINDEDYEIYLLKETNETVVALPEDNSKSIESFSADQLPSEMNVFLRYSNLLEKDEKN